MNKNTLSETVARLVIPPKGVLAIDESFETCNKRFTALGIPTTEEMRRQYRELLVTAPGVEEYISGYIMFDETVRQKTVSGESFVDVLKKKGIEPGIKVDEGTAAFSEHPGDKITKGLDGLSTRLEEYRSMGMTFTKWRGMYTITDLTPSEACMVANADAFAQYALMCHEFDMVPFVEPEVVMDGNHSIEKCYEITARNLDIVFNQLRLMDVWLPGVILKTNMIIAGKDASVQATPEEVAAMTLKCLREHVPADIGGIVFLSGGQSAEQSTTHLNLMHKKGTLPWPLTFSYGRGIQAPALEHWAAHHEDVAGAQTKLRDRCRANSLASVGKYTG